MFYLMGSFVIRVEGDSFGSRIGNTMLLRKGISGILLVVVISTCSQNSQAHVAFAYPQQRLLSLCSLVPVFMVRLVWQIYLKPEVFAYLSLRS